MFYNNMSLDPYKLEWCNFLIGSILLLVFFNFFLKSRTFKRDYVKVANIHNDKQYYGTDKIRTLDAQIVLLTYT